MRDRPFHILWGLVRRKLEFRHGSRGSVGSGATFDVESGGEMDVEAGGVLKIAGTQVTASATEINYTDITAPGTVDASKAVVVDAQKDVAGFRNVGLTGAATVGNLAAADDSLDIAGKAATAAGNGGAVPIAGGQAHTNGDGGDVSLTGGPGSAAGTGNGGSATIQGGNSGGGATGNGGLLNVVGGAAVSTNGGGGAIAMTGGAGAGTGAGGAVAIAGGASGAGATGNGAGASLTGGAALSIDGDGGDIGITGGDAAGAGTGGDVAVTGGASAGVGGTAGGVTVDAGAPTGGTPAAVELGPTNAVGVNVGRLGGAIGLRGEPLLAPTGSLNTLTYFPGLNALGVLRVASNVADGETVAIGGDTFEVDIINTDSGDDTAAGDFNNVTDPLTVDMTAYVAIDGVLIVGDLMRIENEMLKVTGIVGHDYTFARGRCGTAVAAHANGLDIFISNVPGMANIPLGLVAVLTPAVFTDALIDEINADVGVELVHMVDISNNEALLVSDVPDALALVLAHTMGGANNEWGTATMENGLAPALSRIVRAVRVPNATEVALDQLHIALPFTPTVVIVQVRVTATGLPVAWDGATVIGTNRVTLTNGGAADWADTDTIHVIAME